MHPPCVYNDVDVWHHCAQLAWQFMRGWGANLGAKIRQKKSSILGEIQLLDQAADSVGLTAEEWLQWYALENTLMEKKSKKISCLHLVYFQFIIMSSCLLAINGF